MPREAWDGCRLILCICACVPREREGLDHLGLGAVCHPNPVTSPKELECLLLPSLQPSLAAPTLPERQLPTLHLPFTPSLSPPFPYSFLSSSSFIHSS